MDIVTRAEWGAKPADKPRISTIAKEVFLHHSVGYGVGGAPYMRTMQAQHQAEGWGDIAYNFVIDPETMLVYEGRGWGIRPAAQKSYNSETWAVCVMGNFETRAVTNELVHRIAELIKFGYKLGEIPLVLTGGHKDAPNQSTTCPGKNLYARIPDIRKLLEDDMPTSEEVAQAVWAFPGAETGVSMQRNVIRAAQNAQLAVALLNDWEGLTDEDLDAAVDELIAVLPDAVVNKIKERL